MQSFKRWLVNRLGSPEGQDPIRAEPGIDGLQDGRGPTALDLAHRWDLTFALLDDTRAWRERAVHEVVLRDSDHVDALTAYQIRLPLELVRQYEPGIKAGDRVRLLLPFTVRPKQLLLNVDFIGVKGEPMALMRRQVAAELQAQYVAHVDGRPLGAQPLGGALWEGVSAYTTSAWREHLAKTKPHPWRQGLPGAQDAWRADALVRYLNSDLALGVERDDVGRWLDSIEDARLKLIEALGEGPDPESSAECILLAIPFMSYRPNHIQDIDLLVDDFCTSVEAMDPRARRLLAEYGRRWEAILDTVVPVGQVCSIKLLEQRPWVGAPSAVLEQVLPIGDAMTTHVEIRAADHAVEIGRPFIRDVLGGRTGVALADEVRETADAAAIYIPSAGERYMALIRTPVKVRLVHRLALIWTTVFMVVAAAVALALPEDQDLIETLALLIFPLTLAGAVVLTREATSLAERLLRRWRIGLVALMTALWMLALARVLLNADVSWTESACRDVEGLVGWLPAQLC